MFFRLLLLSFYMGAPLATPARAEQAAVWTTGSGTATLAPFTGLMNSLGLELRGATNEPFASSFALTDESRIKFVTPWGSPDSFLGGSLRSTNGLSLLVVANGETNVIVLSPLELYALKDTGTFELRDDDGEPVLVIEHFDTRFEPGLHSLALQRGELRISETFAAQIERPELSGLCVGTVDCAIEVHELEAKIERRKRPPPFACGLPADPTATVKLHAIEAVQQIGETYKGFVPVGVSVTVENPGPAVLPVTALQNVRLSLAVRSVKTGATSEVLRIENSVRFSPAARSPCPDETKFIPGLLARRSLADVALEKNWLPIPVEQLEAAARGEQTLFIEAACGGDPILRNLQPVKHGAVWFTESPAR